MPIQVYQSSTVNIPNMKSSPNFGAENVQKEKSKKNSDKAWEDLQKTLNKSEDELIMETTPLSSGIVSGLMYGVGGFALDRLILNPIFKKMNVAPMSMKMSLIINGAIGLLSGVCAAINIHKKQKEITGRINHSA